MISLYSGTVGSGKSYHATALGVEWVSKGKHVIANFPIKNPAGRLITWLMQRVPIVERYYSNQTKRWVFVDELTVEELIVKSIENEWMGKESQCMLLIDEAGVFFNSRDYMVKAAEMKKWLKFFSLSRKLGYDIVMIAQHDRMIDRQIRSLFEYDVKHLNANNSFMFRFLSIFKIKLFLYVYKWYGTKLKANLRFGVFKKSVANRYDTMRLFNMSELIDAIMKIYEGKVIPGAVMAQLDLWRAINPEMFDQASDAVQAAAVSDVGDKGGPHAESDAADRQTQRTTKFMDKLRGYFERKADGEEVDYDVIGNWREEAEKDDESKD